MLGKKNKQKKHDCILIIINNFVASCRKVYNLAQLTNWTKFSRLKLT